MCSFKKIHDTKQVYKWEIIGGYLYTGYQRLSAVFMDVEGADWRQEQESEIKYILPFLKHNQQKKITHWPHEYKTPDLKQIRSE